ncbi:MAG: hypothetical protein KatS3mg102_1282 [Planctomycetota bacterium]|nr:MAG: hypothetical protein KatS3mg102_1282 [Planctomycetota bacterium]
MAGRSSGRAMPGRDRQASGRRQAGTSGRSARRDDGLHAAEREQEGGAARAGGQRRVPEQAPPWMWIVLGVVCLGMLIAFFNMLWSKRHTGPEPRAAQAPHEQQLEEIHALMREGKEYERLALQAANAEMRRHNLQLAKQRFQDAMEKYDRLMAQYMLPDGSLPPAYAGYEEIRLELQRELYNVGRSMTIQD